MRAMRIRKLCLLTCVVILFGSWALASGAEGEATMELPSEPGRSVFSGYLRGASRTADYDGEAFVRSEAADLIFRDLYYLTLALCEDVNRPKFPYLQGNFRPVCCGITT